MPFVDAIVSRLETLSPEDLQRVEAFIRGLAPDSPPTPKRRMEDRERYLAQLETTNRELEAFIYSVSHDLRAPLRCIDGWSQALLEDFPGQLNDQARDYVDRLHGEVGRMADLIDDMLRLSRISRISLEVGDVDLSALAETIRCRLIDAQPDRKIRFTIESGRTATGDQHLLDIALTNLFSNAVKFTREQAEARIEFYSTERDGERTYAVRDNGVGFDMAQAGGLFGPFQRLHPASQFSGTGVGLAIVQRVIHRHGGRVWAEAQVDRGATFFFTLGTPQ